MKTDQPQDSKKVSAFGISARDISQSKKNLNNNQHICWENANSNITCLWTQTSTL